MNYLAPFIGDGKSRKTRFRPLGTDGLLKWSMIDLRPDSSQITGYCIVATPALIDDPSVTLLSDKSDDPVPGNKKTAVDTALGVTVPNVTTAADLVREALINPIGPWKPIQASVAAASREIWLGDERIFTEKVKVPKMVIMDPSDGFVSTNGFSLLTYDSTNWALQNGNFLIQSNAITPHAAGTDHFAYWQGDVWANDQYVRGLLQALTAGGYIGLQARGTGSGSSVNSYFLYSDGGDGTYFQKAVAGAVSTLAAGVAVRTVGHTIQISASGSTLTFTDNTSNIISPVTDTAITSGNAGICGYGDTVNSQLTTWFGANLSTLSARTTGSGCLIQGIRNYNVRV